MDEATQPSGLLNRLGTKLNKLPRKLSLKSVPTNRRSSDSMVVLGQNLTLTLKVIGEGVKERVSMPCPPLEEFKTLSNLREFIHDSVYRIVNKANPAAADNIAFYFTRKSIRVSNSQEIMKGPKFALVPDGKEGFKVNVNLTMRGMERTLSSTSSASTLIDDESTIAALQPIPESVNCEGPLWILARDGAFEERYCKLDSDLVLKSLPVMGEGKAKQAQFVVPTKKKSFSKFARKQTGSRSSQRISPQPRIEVDVGSIQRVLPASAQSYATSPQGVTGIIELIGPRPGSRSNRAVIAVSSDSDFYNWLANLQIASGSPMVHYEKDLNTGLFKPLRQSSVPMGSFQISRKRSKTKSLSPKNSTSTLSGSNWDRTSMGKSGVRPLSASLMNDESSPRFVKREPYVCL